MAGNEKLGRKQLSIASFDLDVDVRRAAGIRDRLDGAEAVLAALVGRSAAEALEIGVALAHAAVGGVEVDSTVVYLPDLDDGPRDGISVRAEDAAGQVGDVADGRRDRVIDDHQIVVGV